MLNGVGRLVSTIEELGTVAMVLYAIEDETSKVFDVYASFDGVLTSWERKHVTAEALIQAGEVAILVETKHYAWTKNCKLSVGIRTLPFQMDMLGNKFGDAVRSIRRGKSSLVFFFLGCGVGGYTAGKDHATNVMLACESCNIFCTSYVSLEVGVVGMSRSAVYGSKVDYHII